MISSGEKITFYFYTANPGFNSKQNKKKPTRKYEGFYIYSIYPNNNCRFQDYLNWMDEKSSWNTKISQLSSKYRICHRQEIHRGKFWWGSGNLKEMVILARKEHTWMLCQMYYGSTMRENKSIVLDINHKQNHKKHLFIIQRYNVNRCKEKLTLKYWPIQ